jgi:hypothetical protein
MGKLLCVKNITKKGNRISYQYEASTDIQRYIKEEEMYCQYSENIESVQDSIAIIPFLANVLPFIWLTDSIVKVDEVDKDFYECVNEVREGYKKMYPMLSWGGY